MKPLTPRAGASGNNYTGLSLNDDSTSEKSFRWLQTAPYSLLDVPFLGGLRGDCWGRDRGCTGGQPPGCRGSGAGASTSEVSALPAAFKPCCGERKNTLEGEEWLTLHVSV